MKKLLLILLLFIVTGCAEGLEQMMSPDGMTKIERATAEKEVQRTEDRKASLKDGRVYIGMTVQEFAGLWGNPPDMWIDRSTSAYGVTEWWKYNCSCRPCGSGRYDVPRHYFCFENGILTYWSEN